MKIYVTAEHLAGGDNSRNIKPNCWPAVNECAFVENVSCLCQVFIILTTQSATL